MIKYKNEKEKVDKLERVIQKKMDEPNTKKNNVWHGLSLFGLVGWSVVIPTLAGTALGRWLDVHNQGPYSWTLMLLVGGLFFGIYMAWYWIDKEHKEIHPLEKNKEKEK